MTKTSPWVPSLRKIPLSRTRKVRPVVVPAGTRSVTDPPRGTGTEIWPPSAASTNVTGTVKVMLSPLRTNIGCPVIWTTTNRSPCGPPRSPGAPLPLSRMREPSFTPAGIRACTVRVLKPRPDPRQTEHGSSMKTPRPRHTVQGSAKAKPPALRAVWPAPSQAGHTRGTVPGLAPVPWHVLQAASVLKRSGTVTPSSASSNESVSSLSRSPPRRGCGDLPVRPRLKIPPRNSPKPLLLSPNRSSMLVLYWAPAPWRPPKPPER